MPDERVPYFIWYHRRGTHDLDYFDEEKFPDHPTGTDSPWLFDDLDAAKAAAEAVAKQPDVIRVGLDRMLLPWRSADITMRLPRRPTDGLVRDRDRELVLFYENGKLVE